MTETSVKSISRLLLSVMIVLVCSAVVLAKENSRQLTFHPRPASITKYFLITEFGYDYRITQTGSPDEPGNDKNYHLTMDWGVGRNLSSNWAAGITACFSIDDTGSRLAFKPRVRRWLDSQSSIDLAAGPTIANFGSYSGDAPGLIAHIGYSYRDWVQFTISAEILPYHTVFGVGGSNETTVIDGTESTLYTGVRIGSYPGLVATILTPIVVFIHFLIVYES